MNRRDVAYCVLCTLLSLALFVLALRYATDIWILAFVYSLQTHFGIACIGLALVCLALKRHPYAFAMLALAVGLTGHSLLLARDFAGQASRDALAGAKVFRLLSFNILSDNVEGGRRIADAIIGSGADVAYIFESAPLLPELARIAATYPYRIGCDRPEQCDLAVFSRRPFVRRQVASLSSLWRDRFAMAEIDLDGTPVVFAASHLSKPYFDEFHGNELDDLSRILDRLPGPLILAGDYNSSIIAPDMHWFLKRNRLNTVASEPATWPVAAGPFGIAIDHVFARAPLTLLSVTRLADSFGSNHFGLVADFAVRR